MREFLLKHADIEPVSFHMPGHKGSAVFRKYGYGELWLRMAEEIKGQIQYDASVHAIDFDTNTVTTKEGET